MEIIELEKIVKKEVLGTNTKLKLNDKNEKAKHSIFILSTHSLIHRITENKLELTLNILKIFLRLVKFILCILRINVNIEKLLCHHVKYNKITKREVAVRATQYFFATKRA